MTRIKKEHLKSWGTGAPLGPNQTGWKKNYVKRAKLRKWYWQGQYLSWLLMICKKGNSPVHLYSFSNRNNKMMAPSHKLTHIFSIPEDRVVHGYILGWGNKLGLALDLPLPAKTSSIFKIINHQSNCFSLGYLLISVLNWLIFINIKQRNKKMIVLIILHYLSFILFLNNKN